MPDRREAILARLFVVAQTLPNYVRVRRNDLEIVQATQAPALLMFDGVETRLPEAGVARLSRPTLGQVPDEPMEMTVGFVIVPAVNIENFGTDLAARVDLLVRTVVNDATLRALLVQGTWPRLEQLAPEEETRLPMVSLSMQYRRDLSPIA